MAGDSAAPLPNAGFEVVRKGYDQSQVEAHLRRLDAEMRILATDRDAAVDQSAQLGRELDDSRARAERLRAQVRTLVSPQQSVQGMSERMRSMLRMAEDEVAEMLARAETEVTRLVRDAEQEAVKLVEDARAEADAVRIQMKADAEAAEQQDAVRRAELEAESNAHREWLATTQESADREIAAARARLDADRREHTEAVAAVEATAERRRTDVWAESESRRARVEADFRIAMDQRRKEALAALTTEQLATRRSTEELRERSDAEARATIEAAHVRAAEIVADAEAAVIRLRAQRQRMVAQLIGSRSDLDALVASLAPLPGEDEALEQAITAAGGVPRRSTVTGAVTPSAGADIHQTGTTADWADADTPPNGAAAAPSAPGTTGVRSPVTATEVEADETAAKESSPAEVAAQGGSPKPDGSAPRGDRADDAARPKPRPRTGAGAVR
jgi:cell division septum initiation protein DivIVA